MAELRRKPQFVLLALTVLLFASCRSGTTLSSPDKSNRPNPGFSLIGRWRQIAPANEESTMVFTNDGKVTYSIRTGDKIQVINMVYEVSGDQIVTDQPSSPQKEITRFSFEPSGILVLDYNGEKTRFRREP